MKKLFLFILIFLCRDTFAQSNAVIDSLLLRSAQQQEDSNKVYLLGRLSFEYSSLHPDEGIRYATEALNLSQKLKWDKGIALANCDLAINYRMKFDHGTAMEYATKALRIYEQLADKDGIAATKSNIAAIYTARGNYPKALEYLFEALKIYEAVHDEKYRSIVLENIGTIYQEQGNQEKAMAYYRAAYQINQLINDSISIARNLGNIALVLSATGNYDSAIAYNLVALRVNRAIKNKHACQINLANIASVYFNKRDLPMSLKYHKMALHLSEEMGHRNCRAVNLGNIGETYFELAKLDPAGSPTRSSNLALAVQYLEQAISICREINYLAPQVEFMLYLKDAYALSGRYRKALEVYEAYTNLKDSVYSEESKYTIAQLEAKRELGIKIKDLKLKDNQLRIKELELSKKRNEGIIYIVSIALFCVIIGIAATRLNVFKRWNTRLKAENRQVEDKLVHSEYRLKQAQAIAHIGNWELSFDSGVALWSEECCRIYGLSPQDNSQSYERWYSFNHPDDRDHISEVIAATAETRAPAKFYHRIIRKDGTIRHLYSESHYDSNEQGQPIGMYGIVQDVTEIKEKEDFLKKSNERFELVNRAAREAILDWDIVNDATFWGNGFTELFGYQASDFHDHLLSDNIHPEDKEKALLSLKKALEDPSRDGLFRELRFLKQDRSIAYVQIQTALIRDASGKAIRAVSSVRDISEIMEKRKEIEKQNLALREIAWIQSHVVRSPLANIMGLIELLKNREEYALDEQDLIAKIQDAATQLNHVIHDVIRKTEAVEHTFERFEQPKGPSGSTSGI